MSQKLGGKMEKVKKMERKFNELSKYRDSLSTAEVTDSERKVTIETTQTVLQRSEEVDRENKLEAVFTYLFHIEDEQYQLHEPEIFDDEEKELLATHKLRFLQNSKAAHGDVVIPLTGRTLDNQASMANFDESVLDVLIEPFVARQANLKQLSFDLECAKLIEKISELKECQMHLRGVILQLLKSLDLRYFWPYAGGQRRRHKA
jgi:hypothetical protein